MSASVNLPLHHKVQKFSSGTGSPGWSREKGCKTVVLWWWLCVFGILCVLVFLGYCYFMLSIPVQVIALEDHPQNGLLSVERDVKQLLTHSLARSVLSKGLTSHLSQNWSFQRYSSEPIS